jgi:hypothetical protein
MQKKSFVMNKKFIIKLWVLAILLFISACQSPLSEGQINELSLINARVEVWQDLTNKNRNEVTVLLYDEDGKPIRNKSISLKVNNVALNYNERQELYYTTTSKYLAIDVPVDMQYKIQITLSNGKTYFLGSIRALAENSENDISCLENGDFNKDFVIWWRNLKDIQEISINKSVLLATSTKTEQNYDSEPVVTKKIWNQGRYIVPRASYVTTKSTISGLEIKFSAEKFGTMNPALLKGSEIKIFGHIDKTVSCDA